jgi:hypothetical protein
MAATATGVATRRSVFVVAKGIKNAKQCCHQRKLLAQVAQLMLVGENGFLLSYLENATQSIKVFGEARMFGKRFKEGTKRWGWDALVVMRGLERYRGGTAQSS